MAITDNSYTNSYIRITGCLVNYDKELYQVQDDFTNKKYVYWNRENPYKFEFSDKMLDKGNTRFLIIINDNGVHTEYKNYSDIFSITFDGDSVKNIQKEIYALYENDKEFGDRFVAVEKDVDGIRQTVGLIQEDTNHMKENISFIEQRADNINLFVKEVTKKFNNSQESIKLREEVNKTIIKLNEDLGLFSSNIVGYFEDDEITDIEKEQIYTQIELMENDKVNVYIQLQKIIDKCQSNNDNVSISAINSSKTALDNAHNNLKSIIDSVVLDSIVTNSERVLVINCFSKYNLRINELKNTLDVIFLKEAGGSISEEFAGINIKFDEINLSVKKINSDIGEISSEIKIMNDEILLKVNEGDLSSMIEQRYNSVKIAFNKINSAAVTIDYRGLTVLNGSIACDCLTTPAGHEPIIRLFEDSSASITLDARESNGAVKGSAIRLKYNENYLFINRLGANIFVDGEVRLQVKEDDAFIKCGSARFCFTNDPFSFFPDQSRTDLGQSYNTWRNVYCDTLRCDDVRSTSDNKFKENINYISIAKRKQFKRSFLMDTETPFLDFLKNELKVATFNYKNFSEEDGNNQQIGFIANDIKDSKIGSTFIYDYGEEIGLKFSMAGYITVIAAALQEEIIKREELEVKINQIESVLCEGV
ncbi:tail fiber domain-containing protein [Clostridioides difficile]|uniref:tail fiber domain-containing protein n=1 Tax=Clostridioides difficile TaxID=1496 RepID=UPI0021C7EBA3|nr:tail fiber domain-containing protein [Clostridioides difficile]UUV14791.1 tail fiber domain-containing protein [Clostridioides difficile]